MKWVRCATKVSIYLLLRFFFDVFEVKFSMGVLRLDILLLVLGLLATFSMSMVAVFQSNVKRMLAYSSVAQVGYMVLGISLVSVTGLTATMLHLFNHNGPFGDLYLAITSGAVCSTTLAKLSVIGQFV